jgi:hypothetical protein
MTFGRNIFANKKEQARFVTTVRSLPDASMAVVHPNPYLQASLVDYLDGSSVGIWIAEPDRAILVPRRKCTSHSLQRLCDHIFESFEEGEITDL